MPKRFVASTGGVQEKLATLLLGKGARAAALEDVSLERLLEHTQQELGEAARLLGLERPGRTKKVDLAARVLAAIDKRRAPARPVPARATAAKATAAKAAPAKAAPGKVAPAKAAPGKPAATKASTGRTASRNARVVKAGASGRRRPEPAPARAAAGRKETPSEGVEPETGARSKFDLGTRAKAPAVEHIPWGYGQNRITAMAVDPRRLYAYWEIRDDAIEAARRALGKGGKDAWLNLRVYDVSGRIFDGTNAHGYFDVKVGRDVRQWFLEIGKPTSTHCVEVGLKSFEGYFQKVARSGRVEFPRSAPPAPGPVEWMSVHDVTGEVGPTVRGEARGERRLPAAGRQAAPAPPSPAPGPTVYVEGEPWVVDTALLEQAFPGGWQSHDLRLAEWIAGHGRLEWIGPEGRREWRAEGMRFEWVGPVVSTSWEAGPFPTPVELPGVVEERHEGPVFVQKLGEKTRIVYGPWQVVIRGLGAHAERRVIARWEVRKSWLSSGGFEVVGGAVRWLAPGLRPGSSEAFLIGASERSFRFGSELRLAGGSEVFKLGASELRFLGASETLLAGGSENRLRGGSELRLRGASEQRLRGGSEQRLRGASESRLRGGSEQRLRGASEGAFRGASERARRGASERRLGGASERRHPAKRR